MLSANPCTRWEVQKLGFPNYLGSLGFVSSWHKPVLLAQGGQKLHKKLRMNHNSVHLAHPVILQMSYFFLSVVDK